MVEYGDRCAVLRSIRTVLAADCACTEQDFLADGAVVTHAKELAGRRRFPFPARPLLVFTMGAGVVVSAHPERAAWLRTNLGHLDRDTIFSAPTIALLAQYIARDRQDLAGPDLKYACSKDDFRPAVVPDHVAITLVEGLPLPTFLRTRSGLVGWRQKKGRGGGWARGSWASSGRRSGRSRSLGRRC